MEIVAAIVADPMGGDLLSGQVARGRCGTLDARHGKIGGYRTVHYFGGEDVPLFLLGLIKKGEKANLTKAERNELAAILPRIAAAYKERRESSVDLERNLLKAPERLWPSPTAR